MADTAAERVKQFLEAKEEQDKRHIRTSAIDGLVAMIRVHNKTTGKFQNFALMAEDLQALIEWQQ